MNRQQQNDVAEVLNVLVELATPEAVARIAADRGELREDYEAALDATMRRLGEAVGMDVGIL